VSMDHLQRLNSGPWRPSWATVNSVFCSDATLGI
jgi:hypothetical protein